MNYGKELILDLHNVKNTNLFNRKDLTRFFEELCYLIDMEREDLHFWDELYTKEEDKVTEPHLIGTSAIQFITTSNITIHTLDVMKRVYINIFSCKEFIPGDAIDFCTIFFNASIASTTIIERK